MNDPNAYHEHPNIDKVNDNLMRRQKNMSHVPLVIDRSKLYFNVKPISLLATFELK